MSIVIALASSRNVVVGSDGRLFGPARFENDEQVTHAEIQQEDFDKTFSLYQGKIVGACAGLMHFGGGMPIAEHLAEILQQYHPNPRDLAGVVNILVKHYTSRLLSAQEILFRCRKSEILLAAGSDLTKGNFRIARLRFQPSEDETKITCESKIRCRGLADEEIIWAMWGDDDAQKGASTLIDRMAKSRRRSLQYMKSMGDGNETCKKEMQIFLCGLEQEI